MRSSSSSIRLPGPRTWLPAVALLLSPACAGHRADLPVAEAFPAVDPAPAGEPASRTPVPEGGPPNRVAGNPGHPPEPDSGRPEPAAEIREGVHHELRPGETLYLLSRLYGVPVAVLIETNGIGDPSRIPAGKKIFIPGAKETLSPPSGPRFAWPLKGPITSKFGPRGRGRRPHEGIDIDGQTGQLVRAAADGKVVKAGYGGGYGRMVLIDHGNGLATLYAHANKLLVRKGQRVRKGDPVCGVGMSGNARGSHLHFEVRRDGRAVNPVGLLGPMTTGKSARR